MSRLTARLLVVLLVFAGVALAFMAYGAIQFLRPGPLTAERAVVIPKGFGVEGIGRLLEREGVIPDATAFALGARLTGRDGNLRAGEFAFPAGVSAREAAEILRTAKPVLRRLTVPEGLTSAQVVELLRATEGLEGAASVPPEGTLLPETYHFTFGETREALLARMTAAMTQALAQAWESRAPNLPLTSPQDALVLASIVEKETAIAEERPRIAAVFVNRLRRGMRLQSDPTVVYALTDGSGPLGRPLSRNDLEVESPFNTYRVGGLPPQPICNPGLEAIRAVLQPIATDELYFVADGRGGHAFARTLEEHNRNVARWRRVRDEGPPAGAN